MCVSERENHRERVCMHLLISRSNYLLSVCVSLTERILRERKIVCAHFIIPKSIHLPRVYTPCGKGESKREKVCVGERESVCAPIESVDISIC